MKIMHTMASEAPANRPKRRFYSPELKTQVMQECRQSGASVAGVALSHGINANIVHRWLREQATSARLHIDHLAWLYNKASLHGVDTVFMQIRRRLKALERGIHSQGNAGRV